MRRLSDAGLAQSQVSCPEESLVVGFVRGELSAPDHSEIEGHLDRCPECCQVVAELVRIYDDEPSADAPPPLEPAPAEDDEDFDDTPIRWSNITVDSSIGAGLGVLGPCLARGTVVGRYMLLDPIGAGGMGVVYAAYDPELDRKVALKLLRSFDSKDDAERRSRLLREAQAMAKLSHPNVITVHDVGTYEGRVFLAMEFVEGRTLKEWCLERARSAREVLDVFLAAGRGLAAAHKVGLVHRDFKPDNVLIGRDGRVQVTDFGLARPAGIADQLSTVPEPLLDTGGDRALTMSLTETGALVGTPAYMAPEQYLGDPVDAASDQFSFSIALYEALFGVRPFLGQSFGELAQNVLEGRIQPPTKDARAPWHVRRATTRGLSIDRFARHESMEAMLAALGRDPARTWRRWSVATLPAAVLLVGLFAYQQDRSVSGPYCASSERKLDGVWDDEHRTAMRDAFTASELPYASETSARAQMLLDDYATRWIGRHRQACEMQYTGEEPQATSALRMVCLGRGLDELRATVGLLVEADPEVVTHSLEAIEGLPSPDRCDDLETLTARLRPPEDAKARAEVDELRAHIAEVKALAAAGKYRRGLERARTVTTRARAIGHRPTLAEALHWLGRLQDLGGYPRRAKDTLYEAVWEATAARHHELAAEALTELAYVHGYSLGEFEDAEQVARHAASELAAIGGNDQIETSRRSNLGTIAFAQARYDQALGHFQAALAIASRLEGGARLRQADLIFNIGSLHTQTGRFEEAESHLRKALAIWEEVVGPNHPDVASCRNNLGLAYFHSARYEEALVEIEAGRKIRELTLGRDHHEYAGSLNNLSLVVTELGRLDEALELQHQSLRIKLASYGEENLDVLGDRLNLSDILRRLDRWPEARHEAEAALALARAKGGEHHPSVGKAHALLAAVASDEGDVAAALTHYQRALAVQTHLFGVTHPTVPSWLEEIGELQLRAGETDVAIATLQRAIVLFEPFPDYAPNATAARFFLAQALWKRGAHRRARAIAADARDLYQELNPMFDGSAQVDAWLAAHPAPTHG